MIKCLVVDDEPLARNVLKNYIDQIKSLHWLGGCENAIEANEALTRHDVDILFLDINMPQLSGFDLLKSLETPPLVVFTTAYPEHALDSFEYTVIDYLVKPISFQRFMKTVNKIQKLCDDKLEKTTEQETVSTSAIFLKVDKKMIKVPYNEIIYIESLKDYVRVHTKMEHLITHMNLQQITNVLPEDMFMRVHRSFTVALDKVSAIDGNSLEMSGGASIPIGRIYTKEVRQRILQSEGE